VLVMVHLLGACLVWVAALRVLLAMSERVVELGLPSTATVEHPRPAHEGSARR
jgi:hypothetical protein